MQILVLQSNDLLDMVNMMFVQYEADTHRSYKVYMCAMTHRSRSPQRMELKRKIILESMNW